ncbi:MAG: cation acetate symporter [Methyloceanibacter sp.]
MAAPSRLRTPNPHLGAYYGILTSAFVSLIVLLAMFEQLGWRETVIAQGMILIPLILYMVIAVGARTLDPEDFYTSGRRVPAVFNGFVLAATAVGGVGFLAYTGVLFFLGFDALAIGLGWTCGILAGAVLFVPYLRKAGAYTLPSFLGQRFRSRNLRVAASVMQLPPTALLLTAEIKIAALLASLFLPLSFSVAVFLVAILVAAIGMLGGMRALTWTGSAQFIVGAVGLAIPLVTVSVLLTNLPAPQFTYGGLMSPLQNAEITAGLSPVQPETAMPGLPAAAPHPVLKPFLQPFGMLSEFDFVILFLCLMLGTAALPSLLVRSGVTRSVVDQRRSTAWALLLVALFALTAPAIAIFIKLLVFRDLGLAPAAALPEWLTDLSGKQLLQASDTNGDGGIGAAEILFTRDGIALTLPTLAGLPYVLTVLMAASGMAIALAAAAAHLFTLAGSVAEDVYGVIDRNSDLPRLAAAWGAIAAAALAAAIFLVIADIDPLRVAVTAFAFAASTFFPVLLLAIWWPRCSEWGALAAMGTGFLVMLLAVLFGTGQAGLSAAVASLFGVVFGLVAGIAASLYGPRPSIAVMSYWREMRDPDGETIYDRVQARVAAQEAGTNVQ